MPAFIDKNPISGVEMLVDQNEDPEWRIHYQQDVEPVLDYTKALRNDNLTDSGIKRDMWHYASIPPVVIMKLRFEYGVDVFNRDHYPKLFQLLNTEFKYLKTTNLNHTIRKDG
jgi:hypothetical protein